MPTPRAYYNENDAKAAAWLRELIKAGHIAPGDVDDRSITEVQPADLDGYTQCHFFAGIGGWSYALRLAGWPDNRPAWTGSCPCQPFSAAGKRGGTDDARHLWPQFYRLIGERRPTTIFGEQVASKDGLAWLDIVSSDLERADYAVGAADMCAAGVGAPHIRQRLYFVAHSDVRQREQSTGQRARPGETTGGRSRSEFTGRNYASDVFSGTYYRHVNGRRQPTDGSYVGDAAGPRSFPSAQPRIYCNEESRRARNGEFERSNAIGRPVEYATSDGRQQRRPESSERSVERGRRENAWNDVEFIPCTDGKARPIESGTFPLAHGVPRRVGLLRGYGNAIVPQVAAEFIGAYLDIVG